jgi:ribosomal protein S6--L-glutamate ligase
MRLALLSAGTGWHVRDLMRAAAALGHVAEPVDFRSVHAQLPAGATSLDAFDALLVRTMPPGSLEQIVFRMDVLHRLEAAGRVVLNPPKSLEICIDKYLASARLADADSATAAFERLGGDVVVKPLFGSEGKGMLRIDSLDLAWRAFRTLERTAAVLYLQRFVQHPGWDLRVFVLDGEVLTAMRRHSADGWRTNVAQGGRAEAVSTTADEQRLALRAAAAVGTRMAGVDLLPRPEGGYFVLEVNAVPGWRALAPTTGVDVATAIVRRIAEGR